ncbi:putative cytochrome P450 [Medicago truncatula]|uniref:Cytochrome P450 family 71 protein n=1 Tax=Medicago truncatula TaxID=3880 RepID=G7IUX9_MEDTR|nr:desmethyl-deoxy-podophyllotoxin synthase [Medicago truncatula]AES70567.2 cytochrome P450 family 71 protein [Medicago truncatula]RHN67326.1 putative cytochrome P450 [Medicago truncatula]
MELGFHLLISTILGFLLFMVIKITKKSKAKKINSKLPPGPRKLPLIGNIHQLGTLPHQSLAKLAQEYGPLMHMQLGELSCIVVSSQDMAKEIMKTHDLNFANRPPLLAAEIITYGYKGMTFSPHGSYWRQMRKICTMELLTQKRVESFRLQREEELSNLVKDIILSEGSPINISEKVDSLAYGLTSRTAFGSQVEGKERYRKLMKDVSKMAGGFSLADLYPSIGILKVLTGLRQGIEKLHREMDEILENVVRSHREKNLETGDKEETGEDLVDVLLKLQKHSDLEHPLSDNILKATILDIFSAGSDTTFTILEWAMSELIKNSQVMKKAQAEVRSVYNEKGYVDEPNLHKLKYLKSIIKETMRLHAPVPLLLPRQCSERCEINGYDIPAKSKVIVNAWSICRDSRYWIEAEKFCPERFIDGAVDYKGVDFRFIPFGAGRRMCPGIAFGIANLEISLANLLFHFDWKMPNGCKADELDMDESFGLAVRRKHDLWLVPTTYHP